MLNDAKLAHRINKVVFGKLRCYDRGFQYNSYFKYFKVYFNVWFSKLIKLYFNYRILLFFLYGRGGFRDPQFGLKLEKLLAGVFFAY